MDEDVNNQDNTNNNNTNNNTNNLAQQHSSLVRAQRFVIGLLTLLLVDIIWVASSELTEYIFKSQHYSKPFFSTYLKTSLFMLYLPGFLLYKPWRDQCQMGIQLRSLTSRGRLSPGHSGGHGYSEVTQSDTDTLVSDTDHSELDTGDTGTRHVTRSLSTPTFQPIRSTEGTDSEMETGLLSFTNVLCQQQ